MAKTVEKAIRILEVLAESERPLGLTELARTVDLNKATVHRLLTMLVSQRYVRRALDGTKYELTLRLWELGSRVLGRRTVVHAAQPAIRQLAELTGETVFLTVCENLEAVYIAKVDSDHPLRTFTPLGGHVPIHCGSTGKAILAWLPEADIERVAANLTAFTPQTITTRPRLMTELAAIRQRGFAVSRDEWQVGIAGVAAPIFDAAGGVVASIGVTGPTERLPLTRLRTLGVKVAAAAGRVSTDLGHRPPPAVRLAIGR